MLLYSVAIKVTDLLSFLSESMHATKWRMECARQADAYVSSSSHEVQIINRISRYHIKNIKIILLIFFKSNIRQKFGKHNSFILFVQSEQKDKIAQNQWRPFSSLKM